MKVLRVGIFVSGMACVVASSLACKSNDCTDKSACLVGDDELRSCAAIDTGIYGETTEGCAGDRCPDQTQTCSAIVVIATADEGNGVAKQVTSSSTGRYDLALAPDKYRVCCTDPDGNVQAPDQACENVDLTSEPRLRVDAAFETSLGGFRCTITVRY